MARNSYLPAIAGWSQEPDGFGETGACGRVPEGPQEDSRLLQHPAATGRGGGQRGPSISAPLKKPQLCSAERELVSLFLPQSEVFPVKNISLGIMFLGQPFLICLK